MRASLEHVEWGGPDGDWYWVYWWNLLPPHIRYWGYVQDWHDGPVSTFGWWFGNISWRLPWTNHGGDIKH
jgi:hypothetical protein